MDIEAVSLSSGAVPVDSCAVPWLERSWALSLILTASLGPLLLVVVKLFLRRQALLKALRPFPGPPGHWLYGNQKEYHTEGELQEFKVLPQKYPNAISIWFGPFHAVLNIYTPEYAKVFLNRKDPKTQRGYKFLIPWIGNGLLVLNGKKWHSHRRLVTPAFHINILKEYVSIIENSVCVMLDKWEKLTTEDSSMDIYQPSLFMALDCVLKCTFGIQDFFQEDSLTNYTQNLSELISYVYLRTHNFFLHNDFIYKVTSDFQKFHALCQEVKKHPVKIFQDRKELLKNPGEQDNTQKKRRHVDFLDILFQAKDTNEEDFTDEDLMAEVNTFMFAGQDTMSSGFSWSLYCLALNPEYQKKCREEIQGILKVGDSITWDHLGQMSYLTKCIKESLRLYPPGPKIARELSTPITFPDGRTLPPGMIVILNIWALHHNSDVWENPEVFDPERFSQENYDKRHSFAFLPFSAGSRNCIGQQLAMLFIKVALARTLLQFEVCPDFEKIPKPSLQIILKPKNGIHLYLKPLH
ncbi:taurochenodeoxycholic 6 alpha-hydroxylase-like [Sarcophilus harrisii]